MDDFVGRSHLIAPEKLRELTERSDLQGTVQAPSHFSAIAIAITGTGTGLWLTWGSWWAAPWFVVHGMLLNYLFRARLRLRRIVKPASRSTKEPRPHEG